MTEPTDAVEVEAEQIAERVTAARAAGAPDGPDPDRSQRAARLSAVAGVAGNAAVSRTFRGEPTMVVRRWTNPIISLKSNQELLDAALNEGDVAALKQVDDVSSLSLNQVLQLIDLLNAKGDGWGRDATVMYLLWNSIGADLITVANQNDAARWRLSVTKVSSLATDLAPIAQLRTRFPQDVQALALETLNGNRDLVRQQMQTLGISPDPAVTGAAPSIEEEARIKQLQDAAGSVARLQAAQEHARGLMVGWQRESGSGAPPGADTPSAEGMQAGMPSTPGVNPAMFTPVAYDPLAKPDYVQAPVSSPLVSVFGQGQVVPYDEVDSKYKATVAVMEFLLGRYPELYAISRDGKSAATADFAKQTDPRAARDQLGAGMHKLLADLDGAVSKLGGDLDVLDLVPLHARMTQHGLRPSGGPVAWNDPVPSMVAKDVVGDHDFNRAMAALGIEVAANALFLVAPLLGLGGLLAFVAGAGLLAGKAKIDTDRADALVQAAKTAAGPGTALVADATVDAAQKEAEADKVALELLAIETVVMVALSGAVANGTKVAEMEAKLAAMLKDPLLTEGPSARGYIDATGPRVTKYQSETIQLLGEEYGCHTCGAREPGQYGTWIGDHQPPTGLVARQLATGEQILVPHCEACSSRQGRLVRDIVDLWNQLQLAKGAPSVPNAVPPVVAPPAGTSDPRK
jgi:hypothetical protein